MDRIKIKTEAKSILRNNYWLMVGTVFLYLLVSSAGAAFPSAAVLVSLALAPLYMGLIIFILKISNSESADVGMMFSEGFNGKYYLRRLGGYLWMTLWIFLWSLLFVIPGIIKGLSYSLTPYILAKYPEVPATEALKESMKIMDGKKVDYFVLTLSFIGWGILSAFTVGILAVFFVAPYMIITMVLWQRNVMNLAIEDGVFTYVS